MKKRTLLAAAAFCLLSSGTMAVTFSYLTDAEQADNTAGFTENDIRIEETYDPPDEAKPGTVITKAPRIVNESKIPVLVRAAVRFSSLEAENFCEPLSINRGWRDGGDGYYYYGEPLQPGESSGTIFDAVQIRADVSEEELIPFDILVYAESVQDYGFDGEEAWKL